jgi:hypothetical protein
MSLHTQNLSATKQTWRKKSTRDLLAEIIDEHPDVNEDQWRRYFIIAAREDEEYFEAICDYAFDAAMVSRSRLSSRKEPTADERASKMQNKAVEARVHAEQVAYVKERIILLNQEMPNGQRARYCTLDYMYKLGGAYQRIGKYGSNRIVGEVFNEEQYRSKLGSVI